MEDFYLDGEHFLYCSKKPCYFTYTQNVKFCLYGNACEIMLYITFPPHAFIPCYCVIILTSKILNWKHFYAWAKLLTNLLSHCLEGHINICHGFCGYLHYFSSFSISLTVLREMWNYPTTYEMGVQQSITNIKQIPNVSPQTSRWIHIHPSNIIYFNDQIVLDLFMLDQFKNHLSSSQNVQKIIKIVEDEHYNLIVTLL